MPCPRSNCCPKICVAVGGCTSGLTASVTVKFNGTTVATGTTTAGSFCFANQGAGTYSLTSVWNGITKTKSVTLGAAPANGTTILTINYVDSVTVTVMGCDGPISGASVTVANCGSGTTGGDGKFTCGPPTADLWDAGASITVTWQGRTQTATPTGSAACLPVFNYVDRLCIQVNDGCRAASPGMSGADVTITANGHTFPVVTTDGAGRACLPTPLEYGLIGHLTSGYTGDAVSVTVTKTNYQNGTASGTVSCTNPLLTVTLTPDSSHCCQAVQSIPAGTDCHASGGTVYPTALHITDQFGLISLGMGGGFNPGPGTNGGCNWVGNALRSADIACHTGCDAPVAASVPVSFGFDGEWLYIQCDGTNCFGTASCHAANIAGTAKTAIGSMVRIDSFNFASVSYTVNSCDPVDITVKFTLTSASATSGLGRIYGCLSQITLHLTT